MAKTSIGNVLIHDGEPENGNPYRGESISGEERREALRMFRAGEDTSGVTFWHAPAGGGARRIVSRDEIDWRGMRS